MKRLRNIVFYTILVFFTIACQEPATSIFGFSLVNNSSDTIGYSVYIHYQKDKNGETVYHLIGGYPVCPSATVQGFAQHYGLDDTWGQFCMAEGVDTIYIYIVKEIPNTQGQKCKLPNKDSNVLKIYKYSAGNFDMNQTSPTIVYP